MEVTTKRPGQSKYVRVLPLGVPQSLYLVIQLRVHGLAGLAQLLIQGLSGALVGGDGPPLDILQLVVPHQSLPWAARSGQGDAACSCRSWSSYLVTRWELLT